MPIDGPAWVVQQVSRDPLVVCMQKDDPLARDRELRGSTFFIAYVDEDDSS